MSSSSYQQTFNNNNSASSSLFSTAAHGDHHNVHHPNDIPYRFSFIDMKRVSFESTVMSVFLMVFFTFGTLSTLVHCALIRLYNYKKCQQQQKKKRQKLSKSSPSFFQQHNKSTNNDVDDDHLSETTRYQEQEEQEEEGRATVSQPLVEQDDMMIMTGGMSIKQRLFLTLWALFWIVYTPLTILSALSEFPVYYSMMIETFCSVLVLIHVFIIGPMLRTRKIRRNSSAILVHQDVAIVKKQQVLSRVVTRLSTDCSRIKRVVEKRLSLNSLGGVDEEGTEECDTRSLLRHGESEASESLCSSSHHVMGDGQSSSLNNDKSRHHLVRGYGTSPSDEPQAQHDENGSGEGPTISNYQGKRCSIASSDEVFNNTGGVVDVEQGELQSKSQSSHQLSCGRGILLLVSIVLLSALGAFLYTLPTCQICFTLRPFTLSSAMTRLFFPTTAVSNKNSVCKWNTICRTYFTVTEDISTSMIINFHSYSRKPTEAYVLLQQEGSEQVVRYNATFFRMKQIPVQERYQYWADLTNLTPDTTYRVQDVIVKVGDKLVNSIIEQSVKFRTGPDSHSNKSIAFVSGGDMEWGKAGISLSKYAASQDDILFAAIGGDIAYENAIPSCFMRYDEWFFNWNSIMTTKSGHSIPILTTIGNHEAGGWRKTRSYVPFYFHYFPHQIGIQDVDPAHRSAYHKHIFAGHTSLIILDSYVVTPIIGEQKKWLIDTLQNSTQNNRLALYHASAFPAHLSEIRDITSELQNHYVPLFEEYNLKAVYEHHYHCLANTHPIRNGKIDPTGVRYLGQGSWGVSPRQSIDTRWWSDDHASVEHVLYTRCSAKQCDVQTFAFDHHLGETVIRSTIHMQSN